MQDLLQLFNCLLKHAAKSSEALNSPDGPCGPTISFLKGLSEQTLGPVKEIPTVGMFTALIRPEASCRSNNGSHHPPKSLITTTNSREHSLHTHPGPAGPKPPLPWSWRHSEPVMATSRFCSNNQCFFWL